MYPVEELVDDAWVSREAQAFEQGDQGPERDDVGEEPGRRIIRRPREPTAKEREEHEELHEPYRAWCRACVSGRGRVEYHYSRDHSDDAVPVVSVDYGYLSKRVQEGEEISGAKDVENDEDGVKCSPILCGISSVDRWRIGVYAL